MALIDKLTAIANAIRNKTGKTDPMTLDQMPAEIEGIEAGGGDIVKYSTAGKMYIEHVVVPEFVTELTNEGTYDIYGIKSIIALGLTKISGHYQFGRVDNIVEKLVCPRLSSWGTGYWCYRSKALKIVQAGSVGYPVVSMPNQNGFLWAPQPEITIYVDATTIAEVPEEVRNYAPFGSDNATIIYRNSTTGEVITG